MIGFMRYCLARASLLLVLATALVMTGFAHRMPNTDDMARAAYVLAGGDIADLCAEPGSPGRVGHPDCPACQIVGPATVPPSLLSVRSAELIFVASVVAPRENRAVRAVLDPALGMRAPPLV
ncbi:MAG: hypothetical protein WAT09_07540 [Paracoccaceae bacterium]